MEHTIYPPISTTNRFRRKIRDEESLRNLSIEWFHKLQPLYQAWQKQELDDASSAALYLVLSLQVYYGSRWVVGPNKLVLTPVDNKRQFAKTKNVFLFDWVPYEGALKRWAHPKLTLIELLANFSFVGVRLVARECLWHAMNGDYQFRVYSHVPSAYEMLQNQICGIRPVTLLFNLEQLATATHDGRDALSFLLHDLGHVTQFHKNPEWFMGQRRIYQLFLQAYDQNILQWPAQFNSRWTEKLEYLIADLNTHPLHYWAVFWAAAREIFAEAGQMAQFLDWRKSLYLCWGLGFDERQIFEDYFNELDRTTGERLINWLLSSM